MKAMLIKIKLTIKTIIFVVSFTMHTGRTMQNVTVFAKQGEKTTIENKMTTQQTERE